LKNGKNKSKFAKMNFWAGIISVSIKKKIINILLLGRQEKKVKGFYQKFNNLKSGGANEGKYFTCR